MLYFNAKRSFSTISNKLNNKFSIKVNSISDWQKFQIKNDLNNLSNKLNSILNTTPLISTNRTIQPYESKLKSLNDYNNSVISINSNKNSILGKIFNTPQTKYCDFILNHLSTKTNDNFESLSNSKIDEFIKLIEFINHTDDRDIDLAYLKSIVHSKDSNEIIDILSVSKISPDCKRYLFTELNYFHNLNHLISNNKSNLLKLFKIFYKLDEIHYLTSVLYSDSNINLIDSNLFNLLLYSIYRLSNENKISLLFEFFSQFKKRDFLKFNQFTLYFNLILLNDKNCLISILEFMKINNIKLKLNDEFLKLILISFKDSGLKLDELIYILQDYKSSNLNSIDMINIYCHYFEFLNAINYLNSIKVNENDLSKIVSIFTINLNEFLEKNNYNCQIYKNLLISLIKFNNSIIPNLFTELLINLLNLINNNIIKDYNSDLLILLFDNCNQSSLNVKYPNFKQIYLNIIHNKVEKIEPYEDKPINDDDSIYILEEMLGLKNKGDKEQHPQIEFKSLYKPNESKDLNLILTNLKILNEFDFNSTIELIDKINKSDIWRLLNFLKFIEKNYSLIISNDEINELYFKFLIRCLNIFKSPISNNKLSFLKYLFQNLNISDDHMKDKLVEQNIDISEFGKINESDKKLFNSINNSIIWENDIQFWNLELNNENFEKLFNNLKLD